MLETDSDSNRSKNSEDDDIGCYFLQPCSSPYNITEKVQQANFDLFNSNTSNEKPAKVKFKDELVSFEPDLTDDDVNSIESDNMEPTLPPINTFTEPLVKELSLLSSNNYIKNMKNCDIFKIDEMTLEEIEELVDDEEEYIENEDVEEVLEDSELVEQNDNFDLDVKVSQTEKHSTRNSESKIEDLNKTQSKSSKKSSCYKKSHTKTIQKCSEIHCKDHCIEKFDHNLSMSIKKLEIHEKPLNLPPLQIHQRKCCDENTKLSSDRNILPHYNGYRSEYGLSCRQLQRKRKQLEILRQKEITRQHLIEEFKNRKTQQNEKVFCQWLKDISKRRNNSSTKNNYKSSYSPTMNYVNSNGNNNKKKYFNDSKVKLKERPKTANDFIPKTSVKKKVRPHTTHSCVYIEVPQNILEKGIQIGDLLISNSKLFTKKLHILTVS